MKKLSFDLFVKSRLLNLLRKYIHGFIPKYERLAPNDRFESKETVVVTYCIPGCDLAINRYSLQPQTVNARWMHITSDPARMSSIAYKKLPYVE